MEVYTINVDSTQASSNTMFTIDFTGVIRLINISKVEILRASVAVQSNVEAVFVYIEELASNNSSMRVSQVRNAGTKANYQQNRSIVTWNPETTPRTTFTVNSYWENYITYDKPLDSLNSLTISLYDQNGNLLVDTGHTYLTLRFTSRVPVPEPPKVPEATAAVMIPSKYTPQAPESNRKQYLYYILMAIIAFFGMKMLRPTSVVSS